MTKVELVFKYLSRRYGVWWKRRVATPALYQQERQAWVIALRPFSERDVREALAICSEQFFCVPTAQAFAQLVVNRRRLYVDCFARQHRVPMTPVAKQAISDILQGLRGV